MRTIGTRAGDAHRGDFVATCAYCGAAWYRSKLRRNAAGQLICPDDQHIRDPVTLSRLNAAALSRIGKNRVDGGIADTEAATTAGPLVVTPELVVAGFDAAFGVGTDGAGRCNSWFGPAGDLLLEAPTVAERPLVKTDGPNARPYISFEGAHALMESAETFLRPAPLTEPTFYWAVVKRPRWGASNGWWGFDGPTLAVGDAGGLVPALTQQLHTIGANAVTMPMGPFKRVECLFTGSTADYLKIGNASASGVSAGSDEPEDDFVIGMGVTDSAVIYAWIGLAELWILKAAPLADQLELLDDYARAKYGSDVLY